MNATTATATAPELLERSRAAQAAGDFPAMAAAAEAALTAAPDDPDIGLRVVECRLINGDTAGAIGLLRELEARADAATLQRVAEGYTQCARHEDALRCLRRAVPADCGDPGALYNLAAACIAAGEIADAEKLLDAVIRLDPADYDAWYNRSTLGRQTPGKNHVEAIRYVLGHLEPDHPGRVPLHHALAKELEDLGRHDESFRALQRGAHQRRRRMAYRVEDDEAVMARIAQVFTPGLMAGAPPVEAPGRPVFVVGLPRSGTTLVDRIIAAHPRAGSLGEINALAFAVMRAAGGSGAGADTPDSRLALVERSATLDAAKLGERYRSALDGYGVPGERLVDKTPLNFLYLGLIRRALPEARIVHVRRHPVDSCYAMYKTLFRMGYPFTYSLQDTGRYTLAYRRLMDHWRAVAGDVIHDIEYERLVRDPEEETRRLLAFLGLEFDEVCLRFHENTAPAATASAAQVREPIHSRSVGLWRRYEHQLGPLARKLREQGLEFD